VLTAEVVWLSGAVGWVSSCNKQYTLTLFARAPQASQHVGAEHPGRDPAHISTAHQPTMAAEKIPGEFHRPSDAVEFYEHHMSDLSSLMKGEMAIYLNEEKFYDADGVEVTNAAKKKANVKKYEALIWAKILVHVAETVGLRRSGHSHERRARHTRCARRALRLPQGRLEGRGHALVQVSFSPLR